MNIKLKVEEYISTQRSLHLYQNVREAFVDVLSVLSEDEFDKITNNLILMAIHEEAIAQVMHFEPLDKKFKVPAPTTIDNHLSVKEVFENPPIPENMDNHDYNPSD